MNASKLRFVVGCLSAVVLVSGCGILKKKQSSAAPSATVAVQTAAPTEPAVPAPTAAAVEPALADAAIAAPEDFEDEAFEKVSDKTYKAELENLRKEIEAK